MSIGVFLTLTVAIIVSGDDEKLMEKMNGKKSLGKRVGEDVKRG